MKKKIGIVLFLFLLGNSVLTQTTYNMSNAKVYTCKGIIKDSEKGKNTGEYDHNEHYVFTICVPGAASISLKFKSFCTEKDLDYMIIYQGKDTSGVRLTNRLSGTLSPFTVKSNDSFMTIVFKSDANVTCTGWEASWNSKVVYMKAPMLSFNQNPKCKDNQIFIQFNKFINCDSIKASNIKITGPSAPGVASVTGIGCNGKNESDKFRLNLGTAISQSGNYSIQISTFIKDVCDSIWKLTSTINFNVNDCPISVVLKADKDTVCLGSCTFLRATVTGGNPVNYVYTWNNSLSGKGPIKICPTVNTQYILEVGDGVSVPGRDTVNIVVLNPPSAQKDTTVCQSNPPFNLKATPTGGVWSGTGITNGKVGRFHPDSAKPGTWKIAYKYGGCSDTVLVTVRAISGGWPNASCPGAAPFAVFNYAPAGGVWSGPKITPGGIFNPDSAGIYKVTYTWNGCSAQKTINVQALTINQTDTQCASTTLYYLKFSPVGGVWSGPGVVNWANGQYNPNSTGAGNKRLIYTANGCKDTTMMTVLGIDARFDEVSCPYSTKDFYVAAGLPAGGLWKGKGILDSFTGKYSSNYIFSKGRDWDTDTLTYTLGKCTDKKLVFVQKTAINKDTMKYCIGDTAMLLYFNTVQSSPWGGVWTGNGTEIGKNGWPFFNPKKAGYGYHKLIYNANGCTDSLIMFVRFPSVIQKDTNFCENNPVFDLFEKETGGTWSGNGITNPSKGLFDPKGAKKGLNKLVYTSRYGCKDSAKVYVDSLPKINFTEPDPFYCFRDTSIILKVNKPGGVYGGNGVVGNNFIPSRAGSGTHAITYKLGPAACASVATTDVTVGDTLIATIKADKDSICPGFSVALTSKVKGGTLFYRYLWDNKQVVDAIYVSPASTSKYFLIVTDGCSNPDTAFANIAVHPLPKYTATTSSIQCYGTAGFAEIIPLDGDQYKVDWNSVPKYTGMKLVTNVGLTYNAYCKNLRTGCFSDTNLTIPGYPKIKAFFTTIPGNGKCLSNLNPSLQLLNLSEGGTTGTWFFGDGSSEAYDPATNPKHLYTPDQNKYTIRLLIQNAGGCSDSFRLDICMEDTVLVWVPNTFTPNGDGNNDIFKPIPSAATEFYLEIYNRWGQRVFKTENMQQGWDGTYQGTKCEEGVYAYKLLYKGKKTILREKVGDLLLLRN